MDLLPFGTFAVAFVVSIGSAIAGGGGGLVISPYLLLIGLPPQMVAGTPKLAGLGLAFGSLRKFKQAKLLDKRIIKLLLPLSVISGIVGPQLVSRTPPETIRNIILLATLAIAIFTLFSKRIGLVRHTLTPKRMVSGSFLYLVVTTLQSAFSSGIGTFTMFIFMGVFGLPALKANATKRLVNLAGLIVGTINFVILGLVDWPHGIALFTGMLLGSQIGAHIAIKKGDTFVRTAYLLVTLITVATVFVRS